MHENGIKISALSFAIACALAFVADAAHAQGPASSNDPFAAFADSLTALPAASTLNNRGQFYVPVFSSIRMGGGRTRLDLAVTLSIHNASETEILVLERVDYFNTGGGLIQSYLARPIAVRPYGTVEVFIAADDVRGGTGANFLVGWAAPRPIAEPVIEAVMIGSVGTSGYSFATQGRGVRIIPH